MTFENDMYTTNNNINIKSTYIDGRIDENSEERSRELEEMIEIQKKLEDIAKWNKEHQCEDGEERCFYGYTASGKKVFLNF